FNLAVDPAETHNLIDVYPAKAKALLALLDDQVKRGRSTPGARLSNDREVTYLPEGFNPAQFW
ncbi:MAG: arylsulfatase, partial [Verrucomicrobiota bacterium]